MKKVLILIFLVAFTGCKDSSLTKEKSITLGLLADPTTFDPRKSHDISSTTLCFLVYEGLFRSSESGPLEFAALESYTLSADKKTYRFKLKKNLWSDGSPVLASDFERAWKSQLDPDFCAPYRELLDPIKNAKAYKEGDASLADVGIRSQDPYVLIVELEKPLSSFIELLSFSPFFPQKGGLFNGPYTIEKQIPHEAIILKKNPNYAASHQSSPETLIVRVIESENTAYQLFCEKKLDLIGGPLLPLPNEVPLKKEDPHAPMSGSTLCVFNTKSRWFNNIHLRRAFALSIDPHEIQKLFPPFNKSPETFLPPPFDLEPRSFFRMDQKLEAQKNLKLALEELGISQEDLKELTYIFGSKPEHAKTAQLLQSLWKEILGVEVRLQRFEHKVFLNKLIQKEFDFAQVIWLAPYNDPSALLDRFKDPTLAKNFSSYSNQRLSTLVAQSEEGLIDKKTALFQIEAILEEDLPFIPLYHWDYPYKMSEKIASLPFTEMGTPNFTYLKCR